MSRRTPEHWQQRYVSGDLPWDTGTVACELRWVIGMVSLQVGSRVLEIGCGTGTDACWLARCGFETIGVDVAAKAVVLARAKAAGLSNVRFLQGNILDGLPVEPESFPLVYDRGCFHSVDAQERSTFAMRISQLLYPGGRWLTICGNADERRGEGEHGPPQLTAGQIIEAVEPYLSIISLQRASVSDADGKKHLSWKCLMARRD